MRLDELIGIKHLATKHPVEVVNWLKQEFDSGRTKLRLLGRGSNGVALTNGEIVFKLWLKDSAYEDFARLSMKHQDNPFFPKFKTGIRSLPRVFQSLEVYDKDGEQIDLSAIRYVKMELLQPYAGLGGFYIFEDPAIRREIEAEDDLSNFVDTETLMEWGVGFTDDDERNINYLIRDYLQDYSGFTAPYDKYRKHINPELVGFMRALGIISDAMPSGHRFDSGKRNLALRGKQLVILDPVVNDDDLELNTTFLELEVIDVKPQKN
jgi:hypothetical protein